MIPAERSVAFGLGQFNKASLIKNLLMALLLAVEMGNATVELKAQEPGIAFRNLQACVGKAQKKFPNPTSDTGKIVADIKGDTNVLLDKWVNASNQKVPSDYLRTLTVNCELLDQATTETDTERTRTLLQDVSDDLKLKAAQAKNQVGASEALGASVQVSVKTRRNGQEMNGYLVRCNPKRYGTQSPAMFVFNNPTNQADRTLPPGNYIFWLETQSGQIIVSRPITVGGDGESSEPTIWFDIP
jgi:hypothetical protein